MFFSMSNTKNTVTPTVTEFALPNLPANSSFFLWADYVGIFSIPERMLQPSEVIAITDKLRTAFASWENAVEAEMTAQNGVRVLFTQFWGDYTTIEDFRNRSI